MTTCSIKWCGKNSRTSSYNKDGITFHRFPSSPKMKTQWIDATSRGEEWFPTRHSVICSRHFSEDSFYHMKDRRRIMDSAVPTLLLPALIPTTCNTSSNDIVVEEDAFPSETDPLSLQTITSSSSDSKPSTSKDQTDTPKEKCDTDSLPIPTPESNNITIKRLYRTILELHNTVQRKNKIIKKVRDNNRRLKSKIHALKSLLADKKK